MGGTQPYLFINYRKKDTVVLADGLNLMLRDGFGDVVFLDSSELEKGAEFPPLIQDALSRATCMLVLIGEQWLHQHDERTGIRRLDLPDDWVRLEIEHALKRKIDIIPVLAPGASMPPAEAFPESIRPLHSRVPVLLRTHSYMEDRKSLAEELATKHGFNKRSAGQAATEHRFGSADVAVERTARTAVSEDVDKARGPKAWVNGTVLHYYFFRDPDDAEANEETVGSGWGGKQSDIDVVWQAIQIWKDVGIGLEFEEVDTPEAAELRIGFASGEGSWSYVGRDLATVPPGERTMNIGWSLTAEYGLDTALHEIGHILGLSEEHQNPKGSIVWDEEAVYTLMQGPPNFWSREQTYHSILRKGDPDRYYGPWDPDSIMQFQFSAGLIREPAEFRDGLNPVSGLSAGDKEKIRFLYPPYTSVYPALVPMEPVPLSLQAGEQANYTVVVTDYREYSFQTFGPADVVMMLFVERNNLLVSLSADDNSGQHRSAKVKVGLESGQRYVLRVRMFGRTGEGDTSIMMW